MLIESWNNFPMDMDSFIQVRSLDHSPLVLQPKSPLAGRRQSAMHTTCQDMRGTTMAVDRDSVMSL